MRSFAAALAVLVMAAVPELAAACSVCTSGANDESAAGVFMFMTIFMTTLPFVLVGGLALYLRRRFKAMEAAEKAASHPTAAPGAISPR